MIFFASDLGHLPTAPSHCYRFDVLPCIFGSQGFLGISSNKDISPSNATLNLESHLKVEPLFKRPCGHGMIHYSKVYLSFSHTELDVVL